MLKNKHSTRAFIAFLVTWSFAVMTVTGLVLYVVPHGRVAHWSFWTLGGLGKDGWADIHILFGAVFILAGSLHLYFNWPAFVRYLAGRMRGHLQLKRELVTSLSVSVLLVLGALFSVPPVSWLFELNDWVKASWTQDSGREPPYAHAEASSIAVLAKRMGFDPDTAIDALQRAGIADASAGSTLEGLARAHARTPAAIYALIPKPEQLPLRDETPLDIEARLTGTGLGRKTIADLAEDEGLSLETGLERLKAVGVIAQPEDSFKTVAKHSGTRPIEIAKAMLVPGYRPEPDPAWGAAH